MTSKQLYMQYLVSFEGWASDDLVDCTEKELLKDCKASGQEFREWYASRTNGESV